MSRKEVGAFIYRYKKDRLTLLLVTNRRQTRWILPKGQIKEHLSDKKVVLEEAYEEAGIIGRVDKRFAHKVVSYQSSTGPVSLHVYPVRIKTELQDWPEKHFRQRVIVDVETARLMVRKKALQKLIVVFAEEIQKALKQ